MHLKLPLLDAAGVGGTLQLRRARGGWLGRHELGGSGPPAAPGPAAPLHSSEGVRSGSAERTDGSGHRGSRFPLCLDTHCRSQLQPPPHLPGGPHTHGALPTLSPPALPLPRDRCVSSHCFPSSPIPIPVPVPSQPDPPPSLGDAAPRHRNPWLCRARRRALGGQPARSPSCSQAPPASVSQPAEPYAMLRHARPAPKGGRSDIAITWVGPGSAPGTPRS